MSDLEKLLPQATELAIHGETLAIMPLKVGQMPAFLRAITPVMHHLSSSEIDWIALFGERGDDLLSTIAIAVKKPRSWVDDLAADEAIVLAAKVIEANADFFTQTVMPKLDGLFTQAKASIRARLVRRHPAPDQSRSPPAGHSELHPCADARFSGRLGATGCFS